MKPVFKSPSKPWRRVPKVSYDNSIDGFQLKWTMTYSLSAKSDIYFAYTYPFSLSDCDQKLKQLEQKAANINGIYFHREVLAYSQEGRNVELVTITGIDRQIDELEDTLPHLFPENLPRPFK
jgi:hypothetical protein